MTEYKLYLPEGASMTEENEAARQVRAELSVNVSPEGSPREFADEVRISTFPSRDGGVYVCGGINRPAFAPYMREGLPTEDYEVPGADRVLVLPPTDLTDAEYKAHLAQKFGGEQ